MDGGEPVHTRVRSAHGCVGGAVVALGGEAAADERVEGWARVVWGVHGVGLVIGGGGGTGGGVSGGGRHAGGSFLAGGCLVAGVGGSAHAACRLCRLGFCGV